MNILSICIFLVTYGRMIEIYVVTALGPIPLATMGSSESAQHRAELLEVFAGAGFPSVPDYDCRGHLCGADTQHFGAADIAGAIWGCMGYMCLLCFCLFKTGSISKSVFGAH